MLTNSEAWKHVWIVKKTWQRFTLLPLHYAHLLSYSKIITSMPNHVLEDLKICFLQRETFFERSIFVQRYCSDWKCWYNDKIKLKTSSLHRSSLFKILRIDTYLTYLHRIQLKACFQKNRLLIILKLELLYWTPKPLSSISAVVISNSTKEWWKFAFLGNSHFLEIRISWKFAFLGNSHFLEIRISCHHSGKSNLQ